MASTAYYTWVNAGRPVTGLIRPLAQLRDKLRRYGYTVYDIGADDPSHLQASTPEDHCPFSATGWPVPHPHWWLAAIDIMPPPPGSGLPSLQQLGARMFADRQAGLFTSLKYMNYESQRDWGGDCWHDSWQPDHARRASSDRGHIHLSGRSDRTAFTGDDGYDPVARIRGNLSVSTQGGNTMALDGIDRAQVNNSEHYLQALVGLTDAATGLSNTVDSNLSRPNVLAATLRQIQADLGTVKTAVAALAAVGGSADSAAIIAHMDQLATAEAARDRQELLALRAAAHAQAAAFDTPPTA